MQSTVSFKVDPRLASLLGETYRTSEYALKELIDNAWDAEAENVWITLPTHKMGNLAGAPTDVISLRDDGCGMTAAEVKDGYLRVASSRLTRKGSETPTKRRKVKGRKGVGKFAGLVLADVMEVQTVARGKSSRTSIVIKRQDILNSTEDLENVPLDLETAEDKGAAGTTVILRELSQKLTYPDPQRLREILAIEYGRERDFSIYVNDTLLAQEDLPGEHRTVEMTIPNVGPVRLKFNVLDKPVSAKRSGIVFRIGGKVVGRPSFFGLGNDSTMTPKILNRIVGEIETDGLESAVTADWGGFLESDKGYQEVTTRLASEILPVVDQVCGKERQAARMRYQKQINDRLRTMPEYRRQFAEMELDRLISRYYSESEDKITTMISLLLDAMEKDEYYAVCENVQKASHGDVVALANALKDFGLTDMAIMGQQAKRRLEVLDSLEKLAFDPATLESQMHSALESNLWVLGVQYSLLASNQTLKRTIEEYLGKEYAGANAANRPDLFLGQNVYERKVLIEFKRPSAVVGRDAEAQAKKYRDALTPGFGAMDILIIGKEVDPAMQTAYSVPDVAFKSYKDIISQARRQLDWLLKELAACR